MLYNVFKYLQLCLKCSEVTIFNRILAMKEKNPKASCFIFGIDICSNPKASCPIFGKDFPRLAACRPVYLDLFILFFPYLFICFLECRLSARNSVMYQSSLANLFSFIIQFQIGCWPQ